MNEAKRKIRKVFLSGPITGHEDTYRHDFAEAAKIVESAGDIPLNPALLPAGLTERECMKVALAMLDCADIIARLHGWEESEGAQVENAYATKVGIPAGDLDFWRTQAPEPKPDPEPQTERPEPTGHGIRTERMFGKRDSWNAPAAGDNTENPDLVRGFVAIFCEECGAQDTYNARFATTTHHCRRCGHDTPIKRGDLLPVFANCKCGRRFKYMTNAQDRGIYSFEIDCLDCGSPMDLQLNNRGTAFKTLGFEPWRGGASLGLRLTIGG